MPRQNRNSIIKQIEEIEGQLRNLRLELTEGESGRTAPQAKKRRLRIGDNVTIRNPKEGQPNEGKVIKINKGTGRVTVLAKSTSGQDIKIVRIRRNIILTSEE